MQTMDGGDCASMPNTLEEAERQLAALDVEPEEVVADKGYHSNATMNGIEERGLRGYVSEPDRGRRNWKRDREAQKPTYDNRRRIRGARGKRLLRQRGEKLERAFAHLCWKPAVYAACMCAGARTFANVCCFTRPPSTRVAHAYALRPRYPAVPARTRFCTSHTVETGCAGCLSACISLVANAILCLIGAKMDRLGLPTVNKRTNISIQLYFVRCLSTRSERSFATGC